MMVEIQAIGMIFGNPYSNAIKFSVLALPTKTKRKTNCSQEKERKKKKTKTKAKQNFGQRTHTETTIHNKIEIK